MAIDASYPLAGAGVYHRQGNLVLTVGTSGSIVIEAGGKITGGSSDDFILTSTGLTLGTSGDLTVSGNAQIVLGTTGNAALTSTGIAIGATGAIAIASGGTLTAVTSDVLTIHSSGITMGTSGRISLLSGALLTAVTSDVLTVHSSGITLGTSGNIVAASTDVAKLDLTGLTIGTSGTIAISSGGKIQETTVAAVTTANIPAMGVSTVSQTTALGDKVYTIDAPIAGVSKKIICTAANNTDTCTIFGGTNVGINNSGVAAFNNRYRFLAAGAVELYGNSTSAYIILTPNVSTVAYSTS